MRKVGISLEEGGTHKKVGLELYGYENDTELQKVVLLVEDCLRKNFANPEIKRRRKVRQLFGQE